MSATDASDTNDNVTLSVSKECEIDEILNAENGDSSNLAIEDNFYTNDKGNLADNNLNSLRASNENPVLGATDRSLDGGTMDDIKSEILYISEHGGGTLYLNGGNYTGATKILAGTYDPDNGDNWWDGDTDNRPNKVYISNVKIYGGSQLGDGVMAKFGDSWDYALTFGVKNSKSPVIPGSTGKRGFYSTYGCFLTNVSFENLNATTKLVNFQSGSLTDCVINNCVSQYQFMGMEGCYWDNTPLPIKNCNFTNCHQTYKGANDVNDGSGQLGAVFGIGMTNCNFINTSSAQHGGALCIADESNWGSSAVASVLTKCNFINVTSRWFAVYIHGNFSSSFAYITSPEIIDGCSFINCTGTGEYAAGIGISHDNVIVRNSKFDNCTGGQGAAIMVGGLDGAHDGFSGRNYQGNNVTIENCNFTYNVAKIKGQSSSFCVAVYNEMSDGKWKGQPRFRYDATTGKYIPDENGDYYEKHPDVWFRPSGDAGAVYVYGNDTKILDCIFNKNIAHSGNGSAVYILGQRTIINNTKFYNHYAVNGTVFIKGNNAEIHDNIFEENYADQGSAFYIIGNNTGIFDSNFTKNDGINGTIYINGKDTEVYNSEFEENYAVDGAGIFILGNDTKIFNSTFDKNEGLDGLGVYIIGSNTDIVNSTFKNQDGFSGCGVYIEGNDTRILNSTFNHNDAAFGAGVYIEGNDNLISNSTFSDNVAVDGAGVYIRGDNATINASSKFIKNNASSGGAIYIEGNFAKVGNNTFYQNNVTHQGGAVFVHGDNSTFTSNNFTENEAIPNDGNDNSGLGGAIFVKGDNTTTISNEFTHNKARNGSAIYSNGKNFRLKNDVFNENQAWSYLLSVTPKPKESYYNTSNENITIQHRGGDNIINAIHNANKNTEIHFLNVTFKNNTGAKINTGNNWVVPVNGVENSAGGTKLYQDDREYMQKINVRIQQVDGKTILETTQYITDIYGEVVIYLERPKRSTKIIIPLDEPLPVGEYVVSANHPEDWNYKAIQNTNTFRVLGYVDLSVNKTSDKDEYFIGDTVTWTITVHNAKNATVATHVNLTDVLPKEFTYVSCNPSKGNYSNKTNNWTIGTINPDETVRLTITTIATKVGSFDNVARVYSNETDWNLTNNKDNKTVKVIKLAVDKTASDLTPHVGDTIEYNITIINNGENDYTRELTVIDDLPDGLVYETTVNIINATGGVSSHSANKVTWVIRNIPHNSKAVIVIKVSVTKDGELTNNVTVDDDLKVNETVKAIPSADLAINKTVSDKTVHNDSTVRWVITIKNNGPSKAQNVKVTDILPKGLVSFEIYQIDDGIFEDDVWKIDEMANGEVLRLVLSSVVN
ncbi:MAG: DUF11 domain-containing protein, partial [Methanobrevibacter sp.]|nr:DUF11 domain-containing protein [Methanobrevibacter sp.]